MSTRNYFKKIKLGAIILFLAIIFLVIALILIRNISPRQIDDVNPDRLCERDLIDKSQTLMIIPLLENISIASNESWCEYILGLNKNIINPKVSKYNKEIYFDLCNVCNNKTEEIHHIIPQKEATENGILINQQIHKNAKSNLINVCEECHDKIHANLIDIKGFIQTSKGVTLDITLKKNITNNFENRIKELRNEGKSYNKIFDIVSTEFENEKISIYKIKKHLKMEL